MVSGDSYISLPDGISQRQIAEEVGISVSTVSRVLSGFSRVSPRTKNQVIQAIERLGQQGTTETGVRQVIGLTHSHVVEGSERQSLDIILEQVLSGAELAARDAGYGLYTLQNSYLLKQTTGARFFNGAKGVITAGGVVSRSLIESIREQGLPVVIIGGHLPDLDVPSVAANSAEGMYRAVRHLAELGHRRIGLVNGPSDTYTSTEKKAGYLTALVESGLPADPVLIRWHDGASGFDLGDAQSMTNELLDLEEPPTAIAFASDGMAHAGLAACRARRLLVPQDISIVGFHDDPEAQLAVPQLTSVHVDRALWGAAAVRRMIRAIAEKKTVADRLLLPVELVVRESTGVAKG